MRSLVVSGPRSPNIHLAGTLGTGKTSTCALMASATRVNHMNFKDELGMLQPSQDCDPQLEGIFFIKPRRSSAIRHRMNEVNERMASNKSD
ncbi:hypothetical protein Mapa_012197 [Marchantia paleacea]|nr:hypothetical protein Mapa_012197 [Marchantia paleacea]